MLAPFSANPEEREFVVDSGAQLETPITVVTATEEVQTSEEAQAKVDDLHLFVTVLLLRVIRQVLRRARLHL